jgi:hypothetical protein
MQSILRLAISGRAVVQTAAPPSQTRSAPLHMHQMHLAVTVSVQTHFQPWGIFGSWNDQNAFGILEHSHIGTHRSSLPFLYCRRIGAGVRVRVSSTQHLRSLAMAIIDGTTYPLPLSDRVCLPLCMHLCSHTSHNSQTRGDMPSLQLLLPLSLNSLGLPIRTRAALQASPAVVPLDPSLARV